MVNGKLQRKYLILLVPRAESNHRHCDFQSRRNRKEFNNLAPDRLENVPIVINKLIAKRKTRATGCHFYVAWAEHPAALSPVRLTNACDQARSPIQCKTGVRVPSGAPSSKINSFEGHLAALVAPRGSRGVVELAMLRSTLIGLNAATLTAAFRPA
jgi:hypothetical protein